MQQKRKPRRPLAVIGREAEGIWLPARSYLHCENRIEEAPPGLLLVPCRCPKIIMLTRSTCIAFAKVAPPFGGAGGASIPTHATSLFMSEAPDSVSRILVCTGHLCEAQEEGANGSDIIQRLKGEKKLPPVEETPCLGCCGAGAIVCLELKDGTDKLLTGVDETLTELGLN